MSTRPVAAATAAPPNDNPFPGLRPFQPGEEHLFFGREHQIDAMVDKLARTRFLAVIGTSGSGKSSLVNCGLRPALHRGLMSSAGPAWRVVYFRPGGSPIRALAHALARDGSLYSGYDGDIPLAEVIETYLRMSSRGLADVVKRAGLAGRTNLLLVADQFEELFRYHNLRTASDDDEPSDNEDATALVNLLLEAVRHPEPIYVVLTMRSDFLGDCAQFHGLPEAMNEAQYLVPRLSRDERRAAIAGPITLTDAEPHPALLTRLVNDVGDNPDQLSILQHALNRTWARWRVRGDADRPILIDDYIDIGTMAGALDRHAERAFAEVGDDRRKLICERIFRTLTDRGTDARGVRRPTTLRRLCAITGASREELAEVIDVFRKPSRSFLMPPLGEPLELDTVIDLSHESLMRVWRRLEDWTEDEARSARMWRRLTESAALHAEGKASLWRDPELQIAAEWQSEQRPTREWAELYDGRFELAMGFLERSLEARALAEAEQEIRRRWLRIRVSLLSLAGVGSLLALAEVYPEVQSALTAPQGSGIGAAFETARTVAPAVALMVLALAGPLLLVFLAGEYLAKPLYREHRLASIARLMAARAVARGGVDAEGLTVEPDVRWQTEYATTWRRAVAFVLDGLIAIVLLLVAMTMAAIAEGTPQDVPMANLWVTIGMVLGGLLGWLYQARTVASKHRATYGMRAVRVFVVDVRGEPLSFARASLRHLCKAFNLVYGVGLLIQPFTPRRQTLHDWLSGSVVLSEPAPTSPPTPAGPGAPFALPVHHVRLPPGGSGRGG